jgi:hypothetical protein
MSNSGMAAVVADRTGAGDRRARGCAARLASRLAFCLAVVLASGSAFAQSGGERLVIAPPPGASPGQSPGSTTAFPPAGSRLAPPVPGAGLPAGVLPDASAPSAADAADPAARPRSGGPAVIDLANPYPRLTRPSSSQAAPGAGGTSWPELPRPETTSALSAVQELGRNAALPGRIDGFTVIAGPGRRDRAEVIEGREPRLWPERQLIAERSAMPLSPTPETEPVRHPAPPSLPEQPLAASPLSSHEEHRINAPHWPSLPIAFETAPAGDEAGPEPVSR